MKMNRAKIERMHPLGQSICNELIGLVDKDYIFLDLPYYTNIGDTLIWKGTEDFLEQVPGKCLYRASIETYIKPSIKEDVIILFQGGGNFGDIWRAHTEHVMEVLRDFPNNKAIILPQTVHYKDQSIMESDAKQIGSHRNVIVCARDKNSFDLLRTNFKVKNVLLLPDMAFCMNNSFLKKHSKKAKPKSLFFKRKDVEKCDYAFKQFILEAEVDVAEWPSMDKKMVATGFLILLSILRKRLPKMLFFKTLTNWYANTIYMPFLLKVGIRFISSYDKVYSTRLHGAILSILLSKNLVFFDNSYGKNSSFYNCWLQGLDNVKFIFKEESNK